MTRILLRTGGNLLFLVIMLGAIITFMAPPAAAFDGSSNMAGERAAHSDEPIGTDTASKPEPLPGGEAPKPVNVSYMLYSSVLNAPAGPPAQPQQAAALPIRLSPAARATATPRIPGPPLPSVSTAPMTAGEKFELFWRRSFIPPGPFALSIFSGLFNELLDKNDGRSSSVGDYFADSMTRAARSYGTRVTNNFFEKFAYATILRQDPRYHRSQKKSVGGKIGYAVSRLFITQGDRGGNQPNISFLAGGLTSAAISNVWQREEKQTVSNTFRRWSTHLWLTALQNILREFLGGQ